MAVVSMVVGAATPGGATFVARVDGGGPVRVQVADNPAMAAAVFTGSQVVDAQGVAKVAITGLAPDTAHFWRVEDNGTVDTLTVGRFLTDPPAGLPGSFTVGGASCAGGLPSVPAAGTPLAAGRISNSPIFGTILGHAHAAGWRRFAHLGDLHYYDLGSDFHGIVGGGSLANYRAGYDDILAQTNQASLYRELALDLIWDDHDYGPNDSDGTLATKANALQVYGERVPHPPLGGLDGIYHPWEISRVRFVSLDVRFNRSPNDDPDGPSKTMLGAAQKAWLGSILADHGEAKLLVLLSGSQWAGTSTDSWGAFATERAEIAEMIGDLGWSGRTVIWHGDRHANGIDSGAGSVGGFPVLQAASLDSTPSGAVTRFDAMPDVPGRDQYGTVEVADLGSVLSIRLACWRGTTRQGLWQFSVIGDPPPPVATGALLRTLTGSHRTSIHATVCTSFQTGQTPAGTQIEVLGGEVTLDGSAEIRGSVNLETPGEGMWPRRGSDLLAPFGNEIHLAYLVDLGGAPPLRVSLGYYRIDVAEQDNAPDGPVRVVGYDRMAGIRDARMLAPVEFQPDRTVGSVVQELVFDIYPDAVIAFDDQTPQQPLGRLWVVEEERLAGLLDLARAHGKIVYWDRAGVLRFETAPEDAAPVWEIATGRGGGLGFAGRRLSREEVYNAVVATGEGLDDQLPARAVAIDANPLSPTRWGGPFGKVPRFFVSPLIGNDDQARSAAEAMLRRSLGFPDVVELDTVPNPALDPFQVVTVDTGDSRSLRTVGAVTIPLDLGRMAISMRERAQVAIGGGP
jgi:hypothetical protein